MRRQIKLNSCTIKLVIESNDDEWNTYAAQCAKKILVAYEKALGIHFQKATVHYYKHVPEEEKNTIRIVGKEKVELNGKWVGGYNNTSGIFGNDRGIFVEFGLSPVGNPAVIMHELGHFWFASIPWLNEGIVSFAPLFFADNSLLKLKTKEYKAIQNHWGFFWTTMPKDPPTIKDFRGAFQTSIPVWYAKTNKIQWIIKQELGDTLYPEFLKQCWDIQFLNDTEKIIALLGSIKKANWKNILQGWVFKGDYTAYSPKDFELTAMG